MTVWQPGAEMQGGAWPGCRWGPRLSWGLSPPSMGTAMGTAAGCAALTVSAQVPVAFLPSHRVSPAWAAVTLQTRHVRMGPLFSQLSSPDWMPGSESVPQLLSPLLHSAQGHRLISNPLPQAALDTLPPALPSAVVSTGAFARLPSSHSDSSRPVSDSETSVSIQVAQKPQAQSAPSLTVRLGGPISEK